MSTSGVEATGGMGVKAALPKVAPSSPPASLPSSPTAASDHITPRLFKHERQERDRVTGNCVLAARRPDFAASGTASASDPASPCTSPTSSSALSDVAVGIKARGEKAMAKGRPGTASGNACASSDHPPEGNGNTETGAADGRGANEMVNITEEGLLAEPSDNIFDVADASERSFEDMVPPFSMSELKEFFLHLDDEGAGKISKNHWVDFFRTNPKLRKLLLKDEDDQEEDARIQRRLLRQLKDVDLNKDAFIDWDEFLAFFQSAGYVQNSESEGKA